MKKKQSVTLVNISSEFVLLNDGIYVRKLLFKNILYKQIQCFRASFTLGKTLNGKQIYTNEHLVSSIKAALLCMISTTTNLETANHWSSNHF